MCTHYPGEYSKPYVEKQPVPPVLLGRQHIPAMSFLFTPRTSSSAINVSICLLRCDVSPMHTHLIRVRHARCGLLVDTAFVPVDRGDGVVDD